MKTETTAFGRRVCVGDVARQQADAILRYLYDYSLNLEHLTDMLRNPVTPDNIEKTLLLRTQEMWPVLSRLERENLIGVTENNDGVWLTEEGWQFASDALQRAGL